MPPRRVKAPAVTPRDEPGWVRILYTLTAGGNGDEPVLIFCPRCAEQFEPGEDVLPLDAYDDAPDA